MHFGDQEKRFKMLCPPLDVKTNREDWGKPLLYSLLKERRKMSKEERIAKFRNDSVDEIDTTDLENWAVRREKVVKRKLRAKAPEPEF